MKKGFDGESKMMGVLEKAEVGNENSNRGA